MPKADCSIKHTDTSFGIGHTNFYPYPHKYDHTLRRSDESSRRRREFPVITRYPQNFDPMIGLLMKASLMHRHRTQLRNDVSLKLVNLLDPNPRRSSRILRSSLT